MQATCGICEFSILILVGCYQRLGTRFPEGTNVVEESRYFYNTLISAPTPVLWPIVAQFPGRLSWFSG